MPAEGSDNGNVVDFPDESKKLVNEEQRLSDEWIKLKNITDENEETLKKLELRVDNTENPAKKTLLREQFKALNKEQLLLLIDMRDIEESIRNIRVRLGEIYKDKENPK